MREYRYTTPHGIEVTRTASKVNFRKGLQHLLRELDRAPWDLSFLRIRVSRAGIRAGTIASTCPPLEIISYDRRVEIRPLNERGGEILNACLMPVLAEHPHWESSASKGGMLAGTAETAAGALSRGRAQQAALGVLDSARADRGVPQRGGFAPRRWSAPSATTCCSSSIRSRRSCRATATRTCTCFSATTSTSWIARRSRSSAIQYDFDARRALDTLASRATARRIAPRRSPRARPDRQSDHTPEEYMANVETVREGMRQGDYYEVVLRQTFSAPYSGSAIGAVRARAAAPAPARTSFCCSSATSNWSALRRRCSCAWKASAWRPVPFPAPRGAPAIRCATPTTSANC